MSLPSLPESHQGPKVGSEDRPAEHGRRVDAHQPADEGVLAALQQRYDVWTHVVSVLLSEILRERSSAYWIIIIYSYLFDTIFQKNQIKLQTGEWDTDLDAILDFASIVSDDEGRFHDGRKLDVAVSFMLPLEFIQQGLIGGLRETRKQE